MGQVVCPVKVLPIGTHSHIHISVKEIAMDFQSVKCDTFLVSRSIVIFSLPYCPTFLAYFSPTHGAKLLSTDQHNEIRVYSSSDWTKPQHLIPHPHRQFQHLTPIKVS